MMMMMKEKSDENTDSQKKRILSEHVLCSRFFFLALKELMYKIIDVNTSERFRSHVTAFTQSIVISVFHPNLCLIEQTPAAALIPSPLSLVVSLHSVVIYLPQQPPNSHRFRRHFRHFARSLLSPHTLTPSLLWLCRRLLKYSNVAK